MVDSDELDVLVAADQVRNRISSFSKNSVFQYCIQLKNVMDSQLVFVGYEEGPLTFQPTYKYDIFTQRYDTSEKQRAPAWTGSLSFTTCRAKTQMEIIDRILYRGDQLSLKVYSRAELIGSDHRPGEFIGLGKEGRKIMTFVSVRDLQCARTGCR